MTPYRIFILDELSHRILEQYSRTCFSDKPIAVYRDLLQRDSKTVDCVRTASLLSHPSHKLLSIFVLRLPHANYRRVFDRDNSGRSRAKSRHPKFKTQVPSPLLRESLAQTAVIPKSSCEDLSNSVPPNQICVST